METKLKVIGQRRNYYYYVYSTLLVMMICYWVLLFFLIVIKPKADYQGLFNFALLWLLFMILLTFTKKTYYIKGFVIISKERIIVDFLNIDYPLKTIKEMTISLEGYRGQMYRTSRWLTISNGVSNKISFFLNNQYYSFNFLINSKGELKDVKDFIANFRKD